MNNKHREEYRTKSLIEAGKSSGVPRNGTKWLKRGVSEFRRVFFGFFCLSGKSRREVFLRREMGFKTLTVCICWEREGGMPMEWGSELRVEVKNYNKKNEKKTQTTPFLHGIHPLQIFSSPIWFTWKYLCLFIILFVKKLISFIHSFNLLSIFFFNSNLFLSPSND